MGEAEKCPHPREPLSGTPTAQIGGWGMIVLCVRNTAPLFDWCARQRYGGDIKRPLTPMSVQNVKKGQSSGELK